VKDLNLLEAKMNFIRAWQSLPEYGVSLFVVRFHGEKKDELLGVGSNRVMRMSLQNGDHIKTWRYSTMKAWNVNWETRHMMIQFEDDKNVIFQVKWKLDIGMLSDYFSCHTSMLTFLICFSVSLLIARSSTSLSVDIYSSQ
jgi:hypothetical protein